MRTCLGWVIDDTNAEIAGDWMKSVSNPRWVEAGYIHDKTEGKGTKSVTFRPRFKEAGTYEVRLAYSSGTNRATKVPVTVGHRGGETVKTINQRPRPPIDGLFLSLGKFEFAAGDGGFVRITNNDTRDGVVIADAVQFLKEGAAVAKVEKSPRAKENEEKKKAAAAEVKSLRADIDKLKKRIGDLKKKAPKVPVVMGVEDHPKPADTPIRIRGVVRNEGEVVPRGVLSVTVADGEEKLDIKKGSGRREFAEWVTDAKNPADAPCHGEPDLAPPFRRRDCQDAGQLWEDRGDAEPPGAARLPRGEIGRKRLVHESAHPGDCPLPRLRDR